MASSRARETFGTYHPDSIQYNTYDDGGGGGINAETPVDIKFNRGQSGGTNFNPKNLSNQKEPKATTAGPNSGEQRAVSFGANTRAHQLNVYDSSLGSMSSSSQENENIQYDRSMFANNNHNNSSSNNNKPPGVYFSVIINLAEETGPLGIHVLPDSNTGTNTILERGLLIHAIEPNGRIDRDGRLSVGDTIVEVDDFRFAGVDFEAAQNKFRAALKSNQIRLKLLKPHDSYRGDQDVLMEGKEVLVQVSDATRNEEAGIDANVGGKYPTTFAAYNRTGSGSNSSSSNNMVASKSAVQLLKPTTALVVANTRRMGKKYHVQLKKGSFGLGFTITTRDNPAGGQNPIYIKTILPRGAAIEDGRLKPGDRILEVCGVEITGMLQEEAVALLRSLPQDSIVDIIVSRQEVEVSPSPLMPRQLPPEVAGDDEPNCSTSNEREVLNFQVPLNDTGSAGLGISVKGKTCPAGDGKQVDMGIHIKSVFKGGAAWKDGKLRPDDQLININGISLSRMTNSEAMETLRRAMIHSEDSSITLTIARRVCKSPTQQQHCNESGSGDNNVNETGRSPPSMLHDDESSLSCIDGNNQQQQQQQQPKTNNNNNTSPYQHNRSQNTESFEDSFRSSENTVIFVPYTKRNSGGANEKSLISFDESGDANHRGSTSLNDSELSLNDSGRDERFHRDGFGRQSMSEKRHAQLDAKNTDTYRRSKKSKENVADQSIDLDTDVDKEVIVTEDTHFVNTSVYIRDDCQPPSRQPLRPTMSNENKDGMQRHSRIIFENNHEPTLSIEKTPQSTSSKHQNFFSPCCWNCQSPSTCVCSKTELTPFSRSHSGIYQQQQQQHRHQSNVIEVPEPKANVFGLRRSCSLESLQMMMQDLQKEQLEHVGGGINGPKLVSEAPNIGALINNHNKTPRNVRETNDSFRFAVDRSHHMQNFSGGQVPPPPTKDDSPSNCPNRLRGGHSMTSTEVTTVTGTTSTTTTDNDENAGGGGKTKKKKSLFRHLFNFGSGKRHRSKSTSSSKKNDKSYDLGPTPEASQGELGMNYFIEQERLRMYYRKMVENSRTKEAGNFPMSPNKSTHQSMPVSIAQQTKRNLIAKIEQQQQQQHSAISKYASGLPISAPQYGTSLINRNTVGVPQQHHPSKSSDRFGMRGPKVHPEHGPAESRSFADQKSMQFERNYSSTSGPPEFQYSQMERFANQANADEKGIYGTYGVVQANPSEGHSHHPGSRPYYTVSRVNNISNNNNNVYGNTTSAAAASSAQPYHYRQLSLRNAALQHQRQYSSPAMGAAAAAALNSYRQQQQQLQANTTTIDHQVGLQNVPPPPTAQFVKRDSSIYGVGGGQQHYQQQQQYVSMKPMVNVGQLMQDRIRLNSQQQQQQQHPIYESSQVQIYGYNNNYNNLQSHHHHHHHQHLQHPSTLRSSANNNNPTHYGNYTASGDEII